MYKNKSQTYYPLNQDTDQTGTLICEPKYIQQQHGDSFVTTALPLHFVWYKLTMNWSTVGPAVGDFVADGFHQNCFVALLIVQSLKHVDF